MKRFISLFVILIFSIITIYSQTTFTVDAPSSVAVGQKFKVAFILSNGKGEDIKLPEFEGMTMLYGPARSQISQISNINGKTTSTKSETYTYTFSASKEGSYTIPSVTITSDGKKYTTNPHSIKVLPKDKASSNNQVNTPYANRNTEEEKVFVRMILSKSSVYEQEPILATFKIYTKGADFIDSYGVPKFENFTSQEIPVNDLKPELEHYNGENYNVKTVSKFILYPQKTGKIEIPKCSYDVLVRVSRLMQDFWGVPRPVYLNQEMNLSTAVTTVDVKPLPENKPASFANAVGKNIKVKSSISTTKSKVNEAITYKLVISGNGNIKYVKNPEIKFPADFEVYDPQVDVYAESTNTGVEGWKKLEYVIIPRSAGNFKIPAIEFSYFDLTTNSYKTVTAEGYELNIEKGALNQSTTVADYTNKEDLKVLAKDIRYLKTNDFELVKEAKPIFGSLLYWLSYIVPLLIFVLYIVVNRKKAQLRSNSELFKNKKANKEASKRLKSARKYLKTHNKDMFYAELLKAVWGYISDKLTIPLSELSRENISNELKNYGATDELIGNIINVIDSCEFAQYAPSQNDQIMDKLYNEVVDIIGDMECVVKNR